MTSRGPWLTPARRGLLRSGGSRPANAGSRAKHRDICPPLGRQHAIHDRMRLFLVTTAAKMNVSPFEGKGTCKVSVSVSVSVPIPKPGPQAWIAAVWTGDPRCFGYHDSFFRDIGAPKSPRPDPWVVLGAFLAVVTLRLIVPGPFARFADQAVKLRPAHRAVGKGPDPRHAMVTAGMAALCGSRIAAAIRRHGQARHASTIAHAAQA